MKKTSMKKLSLNTETVMRLEAANLDDVHGGITPVAAPAFVASVRFCSAVSAAALGSAQRSCLTCRCR